jgi:hypothetical protein
MFNKALAQMNLGYEEEGMADMQEASRLKVTDEHSVIDEAIRDRGQGYTVFSIVRDSLSLYVFCIPRLTSHSPLAYYIVRRKINSRIRRAKIISERL